MTRAERERGRTGDRVPEDLPWVSDDNMALLVDQYELTMLKAYFEEGFTARAVFSLFVRRLPPERNFLLACGLGTVLDFLERLRFTDAALEHLANQGEFDRPFVDRLRAFRFRGEVRAVAEGTPIFPDEPILEVEASLPEAQFVETFVMNQIHLQTVLASKAVRVREAAGDRNVVDFGLRRMHGADAGLKAARAFHVAGIDATSNVLAGAVWGIPVTGTMAHAYIQAHLQEMDAFRAFTRTYPETVLLVDTYDTLDGIRRVIRLAREMGDDFRVRAVRLDSGNLGELARAGRELLDAAGLEKVGIFASGGLDEWSIRELVRGGAPIDGFGVGTGMGVSGDAPYLDLAYKLTEYGGAGRLKSSSGKPILPGAKQIFRIEREGAAIRDVLAGVGESHPGRPLLERVMKGGRRVHAGREGIHEARERARREIAILPERIRRLEPADPRYPVELSRDLAARHDELLRRTGRSEAIDGEKREGMA